jgi:Ni,Fe-hydrogenase III large subunit
LERILVHLDALAAMAETVGLPVMASLCARHGEALRRVSSQAFGHRLMMDCVVPGGVAGDVPPGGTEAIDRVLVGLAAELPELTGLPLARRLSGVAVVTPAQAALFPGAPAGDAATRARARLDAIGESLRLLRNRLAMVPEGATSAQLPVTSAEGLGFADGPNGDIWHWMRLDNGQIASVFMRDPGWLYWPLLEVVMARRQIEDLPLVLASFGLSSSGVDL